MQCKGGGQEWYYHAPSLNKHEPKQLVPPPSQIPGLSAWDVEAMERECGTNKRSYNNDFDSKYVQLAKQGGRKNLLSFNQSKFVLESERKPKPYPRADWFDHSPMTVEEEKKILAQRHWNPPDYMVHDAYREDEPEPKPEIKIDLGEALKERRTIQEKYTARGVPFHTDDKSVWKREHDKLHNVASSVECVKLPEIKRDSSREVGKRDVEFSKLLQGGYGEDWISNLTLEQKKRLNKWKKETQLKPAGSYNLSEYQQSISKKEPPRYKQKLKPITITRQRDTKSSEVEGKVPFKLSKFANVKSRLATKTSA